MTDAAWRPCRRTRWAGWPARCSTRSARSWSASGTSLELVLAGILAGGHVLLEDLPGLGKTLTARSLRAGARARLPAAAVHPRPAARRRHRLVPLRPAHARLHVPGRAGLHQPAARRRDQPDAAEDPGRAAGGDAGEAGLGRGRHLPAGPAVPRARHRQPDRVRGHLPAARGPARPVPAAGLVRLPDRGGGVGGAAPPDGPPPGGGRARRRSSTPRTLLAHAGRAGGRRGRGLDRPVHRRADRGHPRAPVGAGRRVAARLAGAAAAGPGPGGAGRPRLRGARGRQGRSPCPRWRTGSRCGRRCGCAASTRPFVVSEVLAADAGAGQRRAARRTRAGTPSSEPTAAGCATAVPPAGDRRRRRLGRTPAWVPTRALGRAVLLTGLLLVLGVAAGPGRPGACWPRRSRSAPRSALRRPPRAAPEAARRRGRGAPGRGRPRSTRALDRRPTRTSSATTWWWSAPAPRRWLRLEHGRPAVRASPCRADGWTAVELPGDGAALGPARRRPGGRAGRRLRRPAGQPAGGHAGAAACGSTR